VYCGVGATAALPLLQWSCAANTTNTAADADTDNNDGMVIMSSCPEVCDTVSDCASCTSVGAHCVWSDLQQQVC